MNMTESPTFTVWVTKYWETRGILKIEGARSFDESGKRIAVPWEGGINGETLFHNKEWFRTEVSAINHVLKKIDKKIESLETKIKFLHKQSNYLSDEKSKLLVQE